MSRSSRLIDCSVDDDTTEEEEDILERNLARLRIALDLALATTSPTSLASLASLDSVCSVLTCKCWFTLFPLDLSPSVSIDRPLSFGKILTLFIFLFRRPVVSVAVDDSENCAEVLLLEAAGEVTVAGFCVGMTSLSVICFLGCAKSSMAPPQFFWQLTPVMKLFPFPPQPENLGWKRC